MGKAAAEAVVFSSKGVYVFLALALLLAAPLFCSSARVFKHECTYLAFRRRTKTLSICWRFSLSVRGHSHSKVNVCFPSGTCIGTDRPCDK